MSDLTHDGEPFDAGNARHVSERERTARREQAETDAVLRGVMDSTPGRRWMHRMLGDCGVFRSSFSVEPLLMAKCEGERNVGLTITAQIMRLCPESFVTMLHENSEKVK
jgi:hypothetical protein